jgi:integrase
MARQIDRLSARRVDSISEPGRYGDGGGLWLQVSRWGTKAWLFRYRRGDNEHALGLGPVCDVSLKAARTKAREFRAMLREHRDPLTERRKQQQESRLQTAGTLTFSEAAKAYVGAVSKQWRNEKHRAQWSSTIDTYAGPVIGDLAIADVDTAQVLRVLEPIWETKTETASRLRGRIEHVLDWATVRGLRTGDNPARWRGHMDKLLPSPRKVAHVTHHPALPYIELPAFMQALRELTGIAPRALEFTILTAARTGEALGAQWDEIDKAAGIWVVPAERMKARREHVVPLSTAAILALDAVRGLHQALVFPGMRRDRPLSNMAMLGVLKRMGHGELTVHGFRSSFRDWGAETTAYPRDVLEMALAHTIKDKAEAAYRRGALIEKRRRLMEEWARYCATPPSSAKVTALRGDRDADAQATR